MKSSRKSPLPASIRAPHEVLGITEGEQAMALIIVAEIRKTGANQKGTMIKVSFDLFGRLGFTRIDVDLVRPSTSWNEFVSAIAPGAPWDVPLSRLLARSYNATATASPWQPGRPWTELGCFAAETATVPDESPAHHDTLKTPDPISAALASLAQPNDINW